MLSSPTPTIAHGRWLAEVRQLTEMLVSVPTISPDTHGEMECAHLISQLLARDTSLHPMLWETGDGRANVACLLTGTHAANTGQTVVLMGHFDTVGVKEFMSMDPDNSGQIAFHPNRLRDVLTSKLAKSRTPDEEEVWQDLNEQEEGEWAWLFGRGVCDMKSGVAINIALMRHFWQQRAQLAGNVLFLACPDEENESMGARSAVPYLRELRDDSHLTYLGLINTDYAAPRNAQDNGHSIYSGTVGKLLPSFYILGVPTHVGEPFRGVDAGQIAAELVRRVNLNTDLCDRWVREDGEQAGKMHMEVGVPPITLKVRDLKSEYNVQTAAEAFVYINWLTYTTTPAEALAAMMHEARTAVQNTLQQRNEQYERFTLSGQLPTQYQPQILSYEELCQRVRVALGWQDDPLSFSQLLHTIAADLDQELTVHQHDALRVALRLDYTADLRTKSRLIVEQLIRYANLQGPAVVVYFSPPYYPHVHPTANPLTHAFRHILRGRHAVGTDTHMHIQGFYPYISDLSFVCLDDNIQENLPRLIDNMPVFNHGYTLDFDAMQALRLPVMNLGPWGKDAHGLYERVHMPYSFETVPQLIYEAIEQVIGGQTAV